MLYLRIQSRTAARIRSVQSGWMRQCATGMTVCVFPAKKPATGFSVLLLHGELHLVPIAVDLFRAGDGQGRERLAADACQAAVAVRALKLQLLRIVHVPQGAAAAFGKIRAIRLYAVRRRLLHAQKLGKDRRASDVRNADSAQFARQRTGHEHDLSVDTGDAGPPTVAASIVT